MLRQVRFLCTPCIPVVLLWCAGTSFGMPQGGSGTAAGYCLAFDGVQDFVHVVRSVALEPAELTVELWARLDGAQDWNSRLLRKGEHDAYFITADQDLDQHMQLLVTRGTTQRVTAEDVQPHTAYIGTWHHFVGVYSTTQAEFYVDGVRRARVDHSLGALTHLPLTDLYIGAGLPVPLQNEYFHGRIDEVRVWNYARSAVEIMASWSRSSTGTEPGLVAYWRFDEGSGQVASDSSTFLHHGELGLTAGAELSDPAWVVSDVPLDLPPGQVVRYCNSLPSSSGAMAEIQLIGSFSLQANTASLMIEDAPPGHAGFFFYGREPFRVALGDGVLCVSPFTPGLFRLLPPLMVDPSGHALRPIDFPTLSTAGHIAPGTTWRFQFWFRDVLPGGTGTNLSDAIAVTFEP